MKNREELVPSAEEFAKIVERGPLVLRASSNPRNGTLWRDILTETGPFGPGYVGEALEPDAMIFVDAVNTAVASGKMPSELLATLMTQRSREDAAAESVRRNGLRVESYLVGSTRHVTANERDLFNIGKCPAPDMEVCLGSNSGWMIQLVCMISGRVPGVSDGLSEIIRYARLLGVHHIRLDRDGPIIDGVPTYDW